MVGTGAMRIRLSSIFKESPRTKKLTNRSMRHAALFLRNSNDPPLIIDNITENNVDSRPVLYMDLFDDCFAERDGKNSVTENSWMQVWVSHDDRTTLRFYETTKANFVPQDTNDEGRVRGVQSKPSTSHVLFLLCRTWNKTMSNAIEVERWVSIFTSRVPNRLRIVTTLQVELRSHVARRMKMQEFLARCACPNCRVQTTVH